MKKIVLIQSFVLLTAFAGAAEYNYSVQMKESDGSVHDMGDVRINVNQDGHAAPSTYTAPETHSAPATYAAPANHAVPATHVGSPRPVTVDNANVKLIARIQEYVKANYQGYNLTVKIVDGVVHLNGIVSSGQDRKNIEDAILKMDGVKKVDNQIKVGTFNGTNSI